MKLERMVFWLSLALLSGCGTVTTLSLTDREIQKEMVRIKSDCESIPRVYSGVAYDFCFMASHRASGGRPIRFIWTSPGDIPFSAVLDSVVLPYTVFAQAKNGNIEL